MRFYTTTQNVRWLIEEDEAKRICTDPAFERPYGCWTPEQQKEFILCLLSGKVSATFVFARASECRNYCMESLVDDSAGREYFSTLLNKGTERVSLDSKHRRETIVNFYNNKFPVSGEFTDFRGQIHSIDNRTFQELDFAHQQIFLTTQLNVVDYTRATRTDLAGIFIAINSGSPLSQQHFRNALNTPLASKVRKETKQREAFESLYPPSARSQMKPHEELSKIFLHCEDTSQKISKDTLTDLYKRGEDVGLDGELGQIYDIQAWNKTIQIVDELINLSGSQKKKLERNNILLYVLVLERAISNNYTIEDPKKFRLEVRRLDERLDRESSGKWSNSYKPKTDYYFEWKRLNWGESRNDRADKLWKCILKEGLSAYGISKPQNLEVESL